MRTKQQLKAARKGQLTIQRNRENNYRRVWSAYKPPLHDPKFMLGLGLYAGEGTKREEVKFSSASPTFIKLMDHWFEAYFSFESRVLRVHHYGIYQDKSIQRYWAKQTGIPVNCIQVYVVKASRSSQRKKGNTLLHGTAYLRLRKPYATRIQIDKALHMCKINPKPQI